MTNRSVRVLIVLVAVTALIVGCGGDGGPTGTVSGRITIGEGITGPVQVSILGTNLSTTTDEQGNYSIDGVPVGEQTVVVTIEDAELEFSVNVVEGETTELRLTTGVEEGEVTEALAASAAASTSEGVAPLEVSFAGNATGGRQPYSYSWDFGGAGTSSEQSPTFIFTDAGTYTVTLTVTDDTGATATDTVEIQVEGPVSLSVTPSTTEPIDVGDSITFTANFGGSLSRQAPHFYYFFGDGEMADGEGLTEVTHTYSSPVNGFCVIFAHDGDPSTPFVGAVVSVRVRGEPAPEPECPDCVATAQIAAAGVVVPGLVQVPGQDILAFAGVSVLSSYVSIFDLTGLDWAAWIDVETDWGDGTTTSGIGGQHTYTTPGDYEVRIRVEIGGFVVFNVVVARVHVCAPLRITDVTSPADNVCPGEEIQFDVTTEGGCPPLSYEWDFGDGTTANVKNPTHTYNQRDNFTVRVTVRDAHGQVAAEARIVKICPELEFVDMAWATSDRFGAINAAMRAHFEGGHPPITYTFNFGDGSQGAGDANGYATHAYGAAGNYNVTITATDSCQQQQVVQADVTISVPAGGG